MSRIKIRNPGQQNPDPTSIYGESALSAYGTELEIDGRVLPMVRSIRLNLDAPDELVRLNVEILASDLDIELNAEVTLKVAILENGVLIEEISDDLKTRRIRFVRDPGTV